MSAGDTSFSFRPALQLIGGRLLGFAATFLVPLVLVRHFDPETFGTYKQLFLVYGTVYALAQVGMAESLFYFLPLDRRLAGGYVANSMATLVAAGALSFAGLWVVAPILASWLQNPALERLLPLLGGTLFFTLASAGLEIILICRHRYVAAAIGYALSDACRAVLLVLPVLIWKDLRGLLLGAIVFSAGRLWVHVVLLRRTFPGQVRLDGGLMRRQLAYSLPFQLAVVVEVVQGSLHQYAVAFWFDAATFAIYAVGCLQIPLVDFAASSAGNVLMVGLGEAIKDRDGAAARRIWRETTRKLALLLLPLVVLLLLLADDLIRLLFTEAYVKSVPIFMVWTGAVVLTVLQTDALLRAYAQVRTILALDLIRLAVVASLIGGIVSVAGLVGAVSATVAATLVAKLLALSRVRQLLHVPWRGVLPFRDLAAISTVSVAAGIPVALLPQMEPGSLLGIAVASAVYLVGLAALLLGFGVLGQDEVPAALRRFLPRAVRPAVAATSETRG